MTIKKIEKIEEVEVQAPETPTRYTEEVYVDAVTEAGQEVKVLDKRRTRTVTVDRLESERDASQVAADEAQGKLDEITALEA